MVATVNEKAHYPGWGTSSTVRGTALVVFTFRVAQREELPGPVLVELLSKFDVSPGAARATILRMRRAGWLEVARTGRRATYRLNPLLAASADRVAGLLSMAPRWEGAFSGILYSVPEERRAFRDSFRRAGMLAGYGLLRPGLLISPVDRFDQLRPLVAPDGEGAQVIPLRLAMATDDARSIAAQVWSLGVLGSAYEERTTALRPQLETVRRQPPSGAEALRLYAELLLPVFDVLARDPGLPRELLPDDWPGDEVRHRLGDVFATMGPIVTDYVNDLLAAKS